MSRYSLIEILLLSVAIFATGCDEGLKPSVSYPVGRMSGLITYRNWPPRDSLRDLRLVAFTVYPPRDIVGEILQGRAFVYPGLGDSALVPFYVDSLRYTVTLPASLYQYVVIAQQYGPNVSADWRPVGQFGPDTNEVAPSPVNVAPDTLTTGVDIRVDFLHPPPPPF